MIVCNYPSIKYRYKINLYCLLTIFISLIGDKMLDLSIGMIYKNNELFIPKVVKNEYYKLVPVNIFGYSDKGLTTKFNASVSKILDIDEIEKVIFDTAGGNGAISLILNYLKEDSVIHLPNVRWDAYDKYSQFNNLDIIEYEYNSLEIKLDNKRNNIILINDPCQNPTSYSFSKVQYMNMVNIINNNERTKVSIIIDGAYEYFSSKNNKIKLLYDKLRNDVDLYYGFSASKMFAMYGLRIGAAICMSKDPISRMDFLEKSILYRRNTWSTTSRLSQTIISNIVVDNSKYEEFNSEMLLEKELLKLKRKILLYELKKHDIIYYDTKEGFFVLIKCDGEKTHKMLFENGIIVTPTKYGIRIAITRLSLKDIYVFIDALALYIVR